MNIKTIKSKILRWLNITKPIKLSEQEIMIIKFCKLHYENDVRFVNKNSCINKLKVLHKEIYGWDPDEHYNDFLDCTFNKLLDVYLKIAFDQSESNQELKSIIGAAWHTNYRRKTEELPIIKVIQRLRSQICDNIVIENGVYRYFLNNDSFSKDMVDDLLSRKSKLEKKIKMHGGYTPTEDNTSSEPPPDSGTKNWVEPLREGLQKGQNNASLEVERNPPVNPPRPTIQKIMK